MPLPCGRKACSASGHRSSTPPRRQALPGRGRRQRQRPPRRAGSTWTGCATTTTPPTTAGSPDLRWCAPLPGKAHRGGQRRHHHRCGRDGQGVDERCPHRGGGAIRESGPQRRTHRASRHPGHRLRPCARQLQRLRRGQHRRRHHRHAAAQLIANGTSRSALAVFSGRQSIL